MDTRILQVGQVLLMADRKRILPQRVCYEVEISRAGRGGKVVNASQRDEAIHLSRPTYLDCHTLEIFKVCEDYGAVGRDGR